MKVTNLKTNHLTNPLGFLLEDIVLSFQIEGTSSTKKDLARIVVSEDSSFSEIFYDTGLRPDIEEAGYTLLLSPEEGVRFYWKVYVKAGDEEAWSKTAWFEAGKTRSWHAEFITQPFKGNPVFVKEFESAREARSCRCYALGLGTYEIYVNGQKLGDECLLPGIHAYDKWLQYQTYEFHAKKGANIIEAYLGSSWYKGEYGLTRPFPTDKEHAFIAEFHVGRSVFGTGADWKVRKSPVTADGIYSGETYDPGKADGKLYEAQILEGGRTLRNRLSARLSPPITVHEKLKPVLIQTPRKEYVLDMGQNMVGWLCFHSKLPAGTKAIFQFGETLQDGNFYRDNLRTAKAEFRYISDGQERFVRQHHTFFGFRYVKVKGFVPDPEDFEGWVIHTSMEETLELKTGDESVNQLISNVRWGMKGNFLDTPTDCPQRDERMGWTGDAQIFCDTACYLMDTYAFYRKFLRDLWMEQRDLDGNVPFVVPMQRYTLKGSAAWSDAATVMPWTVYLHYGDKHILESQYASMKGWVGYIQKAAEKDGNKYLWRSGQQLGDWLALDGAVAGGVYGATDRYFISSAYYYYSASLVAKAAGALGNNSDAGDYQALARKIKEAMLEEYFTPAGRLAVKTETAYAVAIAFSIMPEGKEQRIYRDFRSLMIENGCKLTTGFVGTRYLCPALVKSGNTDIAARLLLSHDYPGWLYEVDMGATTVWERWNSLLPNGKISSTGMNSLNHYAYGSVLGWMVTDLLGYQVTENIKMPNIEPHPVRELRTMRGRVRSPYGWYIISWRLSDNIFTLLLTVPMDAEAHVILPLTSKAPEGPDLPWIDNNGEISAYLAAGSYEFSYTIESYYAKRISLELPLSGLLAIPEAKEVFLKYYSEELTASSSFSHELSTTADLLRSPFIETDEETIAKLQAELDALN